MKKFISIALIIFTSNCHSRNINQYESIYIDTAKNIHIIFPDGRDKKITKNGRAARATLAPDKHSAAWLVLNSWIAEGDVGPSSSQLAIYKNSRLRYIKCEPFIRDYWFWMGGKQVAIDCGGRHFAGTLILYDANTLQNIDSIFQADVPEDKRPAWSRQEGNSDSNTVQ